MAGAVLIAEDIGHPSNLSEEARRVAFTFAGVGIAIVVTFLANLLAKRAPGPARSEAMIHLAMIDLMTRRCTRESTPTWRGT